jgi:hypothetical protein
MSDMSDIQRPTRVVVVDADDPLTEVRGEFFWREDHERLLAAAREAAYRDGYGEGFVAASSAHTVPVRLVRHRRSHVVVRTLVLWIVVAFLVSLIGNIVR